MKKVIVVVVGMVALMSSATLNAQGIEFYTSSLDSAKAQAIKDNKMIFIDCFTTWCGPCKKMAASTFPDPEVGTYFNANFIPMQIDMEKEGEGKDVSKQYNITAYPTLLIIDGKGNMVHRETGMLDPKTFLEFGHTAMNPEKRMSFLVDKYKAGQRDTAFIKKYIQTVGATGADVKEVIDWYLYTLKKEELYTEENFNMVSYSAKGTSNPIFKEVLANYSTMMKTDDMKAQAENYIKNNFMSDLINAGKFSEDSFAHVSAAMRASGYKYADKIIDENTIGFRQFQGKVNEYAQLAIAFEDKYQPDDLQKHVFLAKMFSVYENGNKVTDKPSLQRALAWMKQAEAVKPTAGEDTSLRIENNSAIAILYNKLGNKKEGMKAAKVAQTWVDKYNAANTDEKNIGSYNYGMANLYNELGDKKAALKQANIVMEYGKRAKMDTKEVSALIDRINGVGIKSKS